ncbi:exonuclease SbcCD subunit D [Nocardia sp. NPDC059091]|uniref:metallophosphoesterase family protein n=1 Tax=unclassified Nocardia TaxID=2637762 RepID=UPI0036D1B038
MIRLAHVADIHLGARLRAVPDYPGCPAIDPVEDAYAAFAALLQRILDERYDGVLLAGDLFDRHEATPRALATAEQALADLHDAGIPVALIWGNHDAESTLPQHLRLPPTTWLAPAGNPATHHWPDLGIALHAQSIAARDDLRDLAVGYPTPLAAATNIALLHTSLTGEHSRRACAPTTLATLAAHGYDYWALGHVHQRTHLGPASYAGSPHPARKSETGPRGYLELRLSGTFTTHPVDTSPVIREPLTATTEDDIWKQFDNYPPTARLVIWTLNAPTHLLAPARAAARNYPNFAVALP